MAWVKIDDRFYDHPKWANAPGDSIALWVAAMAWCNRNDSIDGFIPTTKLTGLVNVKNVKRTCADLIERRAFIAADGGCRIHDYAEFQQSEKVQQIRRKRSENGKKGAAARWQMPSDLPSQEPQDLPNQVPWQTNAPTPDTRELQVSNETDDIPLPGPPPSSSWQPIEQLAHQLARHQCAARTEPPTNLGAWIASARRGILAERQPELARLIAISADINAAAATLAGTTAPQSEQRAAAPTHPDTCECEGTGFVPVDPDDESRTAEVTRCKRTEWPDAQVIPIRGAS